MRRITSSFPARAAIVAALLAVLVGAVAAAAPAAAAKATLRVVKLTPLTIRGTGFKPAEHVKVALSAGASGTVRGTATAAGMLTVSFPKAKVTACTAYTVRAVGAAGTKAIFKRTVATSCKPAVALKFTGTDVIVAGTHFRAGEKLTVSLVEGGGSHKRSATARPTGAFSVNFGALPMSECTAYKLTIKGSLGSRYSASQEALPC